MCLGYEKAWKIKEQLKILNMFFMLYKPRSENSLGFKSLRKFSDRHDLLGWYTLRLHFGELNCVEYGCRWQWPWDLIMSQRQLMLRKHWNRWFSSIKNMAGLSLQLFMTSNSSPPRDIDVTVVRDLWHTDRCITLSSTILHNFKLLVTIMSMAYNLYT